MVNSYKISVCKICSPWEQSSETGIFSFSQHSHPQMNHDLLGKSVTKVGVGYMEFSPSKCQVDSITERKFLSIPSHCYLHLSLA